MKPGPGGPDPTMTRISSSKRARNFSADVFLAAVVAYYVRIRLMAVEPPVRL